MASFSNLKSLKSLTKKRKDKSIAVTVNNNDTDANELAAAMTGLKISDSKKKSGKKKSSYDHEEAFQAKVAAKQKKWKDAYAGDSDSEGYVSSGYDSDDNISKERHVPGTAAWHARNDAIDQARARQHAREDRRFAEAHVRQMNHDDGIFSDSDDQRAYDEQEAEAYAQWEAEKEEERLKTPPGWKSTTSSKGKKFYYNTAPGKQAEKLFANKDGRFDHENLPKLREHIKKKEEEQRASTTTLPKPWKEAKSKSTGKKYFWNPVNNVRFYPKVQGVFDKGEAEDAKKRASAAKKGGASDQYTYYWCPALETTSYDPNMPCPEDLHAIGVKDYKPKGGNKSKHNKRMSKKYKRKTTKRTKRRKRTRKKKRRKRRGGLGGATCYGPGDCNSDRAKQSQGMCLSFGFNPKTRNSDCKWGAPPVAASMMAPACADDMTYVFSGNKKGTPLCQNIKNRKAKMAAEQNPAKKAQMKAVIDKQCGKMGYVYCKKTCGVCTPKGGRRKTKRRRKKKRKKKTRR